MKILKYFLAVAALVSFAACNHDADEIDYAAMEKGAAFIDHRDVVVNDLTIGEEFSLTWNAAFFGRGIDVEYTVEALYNGNTHTLATTDQLYYLTTNKDLFDALGISLTGKYEIEFSLTAAAVNGTVDPTKDTMKVKFDYDKVTYLWILGDYQDWKVNGEGPASRLLQGSDAIFRGFLQLPSDGSFKFTSQPNWDGTNYGAGEGEGALATGDAGNLSLAAGLYYVEANVENLSYKAIKLTSVSLIGEAVGGWDKDVEMTYDAANKTWVAVANTVAEKEYKVRFNNAWSVGDDIDCSLGGDVADLLFKGSNLKAVNEGITSFTLSLFDYPYNISEGAVTENEEVLYVVNSNNSWDYYAGIQMKANYKDDAFANTFCGLTTLDADGEFLFARMKTPLGTRFGGAKDALVEYAGGAEAQGIAAEKGLHYVYADLAAKKAVNIHITSVALVGGFNNWDKSAPAELTYDAATKTWKGNVDFANNGEFKVIFNKSWNSNIDGVEHQLTLGGSLANLEIGGGNIYMEAGKHSFELNLNTTPFTLATDGLVQEFSPNPDRIGVTGDFGDINWTTDASPQLWGNKDEGKYWGYVSMYGATYGFKFTFGLTWVSGQLNEGTEYEYTLGVGDNMSIPDGLYRWDVNLKENTAKATPLTVGLIGSATTGSNDTGWTTDIDFTRDEADGLYKINDLTLYDGEMKVRFNDGWDWSLGTSLDDMQDGGSNIVVKAGTYDLALDLTHTPIKMTLTAK